MSLVKSKNLDILRLFDVVLEVAAHAKESLENAKRKQKGMPKEAFRAYLSAIET